MGTTLKSSAAVECSRDLPSSFQLHVQSLTCPTSNLWVQPPWAEALHFASQFVHWLRTDFLSSYEATPQGRASTRKASLSVHHNSEMNPSVSVAIQQCNVLTLKCYQSPPYHLNWELCPGHTLLQCFALCQPSTFPKTSATLFIPVACRQRLHVLAATCVS